MKELLHRFVSHRVGRPAEPTVKRASPTEMATNPVAEPDLARLQAFRIAGVVNIFEGPTAGLQAEFHDSDASRFEPADPEPEKAA